VIPEPQIADTANVSAPSCEDDLWRPGWETNRLSGSIIDGVDAEEGLGSVTVHSLYAGEISLWRCIIIIIILLLFFNYYLFSIYTVVPLPRHDIITRTREKKWSPTQTLRHSSGVELNRKRKGELLPPPPKLIPVAARRTYNLVHFESQRRKKVTACLLLHSTK
jgi:hypothetical protein